MKNIILFILSVFLLTSLAHAQKSDLTPEAQKLVFEAISEEVFLQDHGKIRAPQKIEDLSYLLTDEEVLTVKGKSFSSLDNKVIGYYCEMALLGRGKIESRYDFEITFCDLSL